MRNAASFIAQQSEFAETGILQTAVRAARRVWKAWRNRTQVMRLVDFDDYMLADIGLTRRDVEAALTPPFAYDPSRELQRRALRNRRAGWNA